MTKFCILTTALLGGVAWAAEDPQNTQPVKPLPYTTEELLSPKIRDTYEGDNLNLVAFPMGGIGSGCISLAGTGKLVDWEIFNQPNKGYQPRFSFLSVWTKSEGEEPVFKVLEGQLRERMDGPLYLARGMFGEGHGIGPQQTQAAGLPRMRNCKFIGRFPYAQVELSDPSLPLTATIEGWSPFIPGNSRDSSLPVAVLNVTLRNTSSKPVEFALAANVQNRAGKINEIVRENDFSAVLMHDGKDDPDAASMVLAIPAKCDIWQRNWDAGHNFMSLQHFVDTFALHGLMDSYDFVLTDRNAAPASAQERGPGSPAKDENALVGSLGVRRVLKPGESFTMPVLIGWYFPKGPTWRNYYATQWKSAGDVARYALGNLPRLSDETRRFQKTFFDSTLPGTVLEAVSSQLSILRSPTVIRFEDGTLYGWEGCAAAGRLGHGTCNHVWNYQQAIPYLFPDLQRSIIENFWAYGVDDQGKVSHRMPDKHGEIGTNFPAADGQFGQICWVYREWRISGDTAWLKRMWPTTKKALEYAWVAWDKDKDGLLEGAHHNTLDLNFTTAETMCGSLYQAALLAGEKMALAVGDKEAAARYRQVFDLGKKNSDENLFNGDYYQQMLPASGDFQVGAGCLSEQVHGQLYAQMLGLEDIYDRANIHSALGNLFKNNYCDNFNDRINANRAYSINEDRGILIATWPRGGKPVHPLLYCDETQIGYEYQVAGNLLYEGYIPEGLAVIRSIRDRFDGKRRNPFCEFEWGNHYARSMANYNALLALSGYRADAPNGRVEFAPKLAQKDFKSFFAANEGWGSFSQKADGKKLDAEISISWGKLKLKSLALGMPDGQSASTANLKVGKTVIPATLKASGKQALITLADGLDLTPGKPLQITLN
jgi:non-lysosomal glucosylceramidase